ncbi:MAG: GIY-YIG nuclease family protein [Parcubacteria group bacterium]
MYAIYSLFFKNEKRIYVGMTNDINRRMAEHRRGKTKSTKNRGGFDMKIIEMCESREIARNRELYWKSGCGKERLKIIAGWSNGSSRGS